MSSFDSFEVQRSGEMKQSESRRADQTHSSTSRELLLLEMETCHVQKGMLMQSSVREKM